MTPDPPRAVRVAGVLLLAALVVSAAPASGDVLSTDTDSTDHTSSVSQIQAENNLTAVTGISGNNTTHITQVVAENVTENPVMEIEVNGTGYVAHVNASMTNVSTARASEGVHYNASFQEGHLADIQHGIGENVTVHAAYYNNSSDTTKDHNITFYVEYDNSTTTENVNDSDVSNGDIATATEEDGIFGTSIRATDESEIETGDRKVDGQQTDVVIVLSNTSVNTDYDSVIASDTEAGDALFAMPLSVSSAALEAEKLPVRVYYKQAPDSVDTTSDTYAVYHEDYGGEPAVVVNLGDSFQDADKVSVRSLGSVGFLRALQHQAATTSIGQRASGLNPLHALPDLGGVLISVSVPLAATRRRETEIEFDDDSDAGRDSDGDGDDGQNGDLDAATPAAPNQPASPATPGGDQPTAVTGEV